MSWRDFLENRERSKAFAGIAGFSGGSRTLTAAGSVERDPVSGVTDGSFETLGVRPILGRTFDRSHIKAGAERVVMLGHGTWQRRFGGDPSLVGRSITINGAAPRSSVCFRTRSSFRFAGDRVVAAARALAPAGGARLLALARRDWQARASSHC